VAGSTDVGLWVNKDHRDIAPVIHIGHLERAEAITVSDEHASRSAPACQLHLGLRAAGPRTLFPQMDEVWDRIGGEQVRNMGTLGGNIANGSPIGDTPPGPDRAWHATLRKGSKTGIAHACRWKISSSNTASRTAARRIRRERHPAGAAEGAFFAVYKISKRRDEDISALCGAFHASPCRGHGDLGKDCLWRNGRHAEARQTAKRP
jgi:xanthine dehydrogenase small subunit